MGTSIGIESPRGEVRGGQAQQLLSVGAEEAGFQDLGDPAQALRNVAGHIGVVEVDHARHILYRKSGDDLGLTLHTGMQQLVLLILEKAQDHPAQQEGHEQEQGRQLRPETDWLEVLQAVGHSTGGELSALHSNQEPS